MVADRYALVDKDGAVLSVTLLDPNTDGIPAGVTLVKVAGSDGSTIAQPGAKWDGQRFTYTPEVYPPSIEEQIAELRKDVEALKATKER